MAVRLAIHNKCCGCLIISNELVNLTCLWTRYAATLSFISSKGGCGYISPTFLSSPTQTSLLLRILLFRELCFLLFRLIKCATVDLCLYWERHFLFTRADGSLLKNSHRWTPNVTTHLFFTNTISYRNFFSSKNVCYFYFLNFFFTRIVFSWETSIKFVSIDTFIPLLA